MSKPFRIHRFVGPPYDAGLAVGRRIGSRLGHGCRHLIETWPARDGVIDRAKLDAGALTWVDGLSERYRDELRGLADGSGVPLRTIASAYYADACCCSGFIVTLADGHAWVARNNDAWAPELWHAVMIHEITGRMSRIAFGFEADTFATTGMNEARLWLHYNAGPTPDAPSGTRPCFAPYIVVTEALETCRSLADVEALLGRWERTHGMILFVVEGKTNESAILECGCREHVRKPATDGALVATNHTCRTDPAAPPAPADPGEQRSIARCARIETLLSNIPAHADARTLRSMLADDEVEQREPDRLTVFSTVACPATGELWFACGNGPAASSGTWSQVEWR